MGYLAKIKNIIGVFAIILSIMGLVTFAQFIIEESIQTTMFGTWAAQDAQDWHTVKIGADLIKKQTKLLFTVTKICGWIQPLAWISYNEYGKAAGYYTRALDAKIIAHAPELYAGELVTIYFRPKSFIEKDNKIIGTNGNVSVIVSKRPASPVWPITGIVSVDKTGQIIIAESL